MMKYDGYTLPFTVGGERLRLTAGSREDGTLGEVALSWGKHGSTTAGLADAYATAVTAGLEHGVPLPELLRSGFGRRFAPGGSTDDPEISRAVSVLDYVARRLALDWLPAADRGALGVTERPSGT
jgi:ribonucleoside-diphosphate reductase alpha chain